MGKIYTSTGDKQMITELAKRMSEKRNIPVQDCIEIVQRQITKLGLDEVTRRLK